MKMDKHRRTLVKTLIWRLLAVFITWIIAYIFSRDFRVSTAIAITANLIKTICYYVHERMWNKITFGKK